MTVGEIIEFCGCASVYLQQNKNDTHVIKNDDLKAIIKNAKVEQFELNFSDKTIKMIK